MQGALEQDTRTLTGVGAELGKDPVKKKSAGPTVVSPPPLTCSDLAASARPLASSAPPPVPEEVRLQTNTEATQRAVTLVVVTPSPVSAQSPHSLQVRSRFLSGHLPSDA